MKVFRVRWRIKGAHVHVRIFVGSSNSTLALCGTLMMTKAEFRAFRQATAADTFQILPEESEDA
jgi:hypothetical protein